MKYCDLHCHSNFSDGSCSPEQLVELACQENLSAVALTDHNSVDGIDAFLKAADGKIDACAGCEFTTEDNGQELHLLGLFLNPAKLNVIQKALEEQRRRKEDNNRMTILRLSQDGYNLSYEEFLRFAGTGSKNRVHIGRYLMSKGIVSDVKEAFSGLLSPERGYYHSGRKLDFYQMIPLISEAGGIAVWAHPLFNVDRTACEAILEKAKKCGLDGVEVYYTTYSEDDTSFMLEISEKYRLLQSGGSDFHGENKQDIHIGTGYGNLKIPYALYQRMQEYSARRDS